MKCLFDHCIETEGGALIHLGKTENASFNLKILLFLKKNENLKNYLKI